MGSPREEDNLLNEIFWEPALSVPQPLPVFPGNVLREGSGRITESPAKVGTRSMTHEGLCRAGVLGDQAGGRVSWKLLQEHRSWQLPRRDSLCIPRRLSELPLALGPRGGGHHDLWCVHPACTFHEETHRTPELAMCTHGGASPPRQAPSCTCTPMHVHGP